MAEPGYLDDMVTFLAQVESCEDSMQSADLYFGHGTDNAFDEAVWLVAHATGVDLSSDDELPWHRDLGEGEIERIRQLLGLRLETRKPLAYLINEAWFAGERFYVDERVIVPRSHLGEWIRERFLPWIDTDKVSDILDLCTGSGCIAVALARHFPQAKVTATDLSVDALEVAYRNVVDHDLESSIRLCQGDLFEAVPGQRFDLIVSNPPYVADELMQELPDEYLFEPTMAFAGGHDGLELLCRIIEQAPDHLTPEGVLIVEAGSAGPELARRYPLLPFIWLAAGDSDEVLFLLTRDDIELHAHRIPGSVENPMA
jgi:ribosomal protein L3 glutamine methyltransferase